MLVVTRASPEVHVKGAPGFASRQSARHRGCSSPLQGSSCAPYSVLLAGCSQGRGFSLSHHEQEAIILTRYLAQWLSDQPRVLLYRSLLARCLFNPLKHHSPAEDVCLFFSPEDPALRTDPAFCV